MKNIGIALSGGGARGIGHLGMLKALDEVGIKPEILSGTSAGSIVGSLYSYGYSPDEILGFVKATSVFSSLRPSLSFKGLMNIDSLGEIIRKYIPEDDFSSLKIPLTITATDVVKGNTAYITSGSVSEAIMASSCIPVFFNPVKRDEQVLVDGGILDNLPASIIRKKCRFLFGLHTNPISSDFEVKYVKSIIERSLLMAINGNTIKSKEFCDVIIEPPSMGKFSGFDLKKADEMVEVAYHYTKKFIEKNRKNWEI